MISESQTTNAISFWLMEWLRAKIPVPKEVTCDSCKALLTAVIRVFAKSQGIDDYVAKCWDNDMPMCYVRIDVAHFIKGYANFLSKTNRRVKTLFLKCMGQLILAQTLKEAEEILSAIIIIAKSETEGFLPDGTPTLSEIYKEKMKHILTDSELSFAEDSGSLEDDEINLEISDTKNAYGKWANDICTKVSNQLIDNGDRANAHFNPSFLDRLIMRDIKGFPLWSCICRKQFGYDRIPASSAVVEAEFNNIKCRLFANALPTRADLFVFRHMDYINGRTKLVDAQPITISPDTEEKQKKTLDIDLIEEKHIASNNKGSSQSDIATPICSTCKSDDKSTSIHLCNCIVCNKFVHAFDRCSQVFDTEKTHSTQRICTLCQNISKNDISNAIDSNEVENWQVENLTLKSTKKRSRYLDKNNICLDLEETRLAKIPILRNGNSVNLKPVNINGKKISIIHTCAFDSIFQLFLIMLFQNKYIKAMATDYSNNIFFKMTLDTFTHGVSRNIYHLRAVILSDIFEAKETFDNYFLINCEVSVGYLFKKLFNDIPSLKEITSCNKCDNMREKSFSTIQVKISDLMHSEFPNTIINNFMLKPKSCHQKNTKLENAECTGTLTTEISEIGK